MLSNGGKIMLNGGEEGGEGGRGGGDSEEGAGDNADARRQAKALGKRGGEKRQGATAACTRLRALPRCRETAGQQTQPMDRHRPSQGPLPYEELAELFTALLAPPCACGPGAN